MNLSTKILIGLGLGIIAGLELGAEGVDFAKTWIGPFGTIFMNMIKMIIVPLVFSSLVIGVCSLGDIKKIGRIGGKTMAYYLGTTAFAIVLGIFLGTVLEPGAGVNMPGEGVKAAAKAAPPIMQVIIDIFPTNAMEAMLKANMLQIIVFSLFMGIGITAVGDRAKTLYNVFDGLAEVSYKIVGFIMNVAPIGVFGLITPVVAANGPAVLLPLLKVVIAVYLGCFLHAVIVYGGLLKFVGKISPVKVLQSNFTGTGAFVYQLFLRRHIACQHAMHPKAGCFERHFQFCTAFGRYDQYGWHCCLSGSLRTLHCADLWGRSYDRAVSDYCSYWYAGFDRHCRCSGGRFYHADDDIDGDRLAA